MKVRRIAAAAISLVMLSSCISFGEAKAQDYEVSSEGVLTWASGCDSIYVPSDYDGLTIWKIGENAFQDNDEVLYLDTGESVSVIGDYAFAGSALQSATVNYPVEQIGAYAFADSQLESIWFDGINPPVFGGMALANTGPLEVIISCLGDEEEWTDAIANAKLDDNFYILRQHQYEESGFYDDQGNPIITCSLCGDVAQYEEGEGGVENPFVDVPADAWYHDYVSIAYGFGILNGKSDGVFDPNANMTLAEAAKIAAVIHQYQLTGNTDIPTYGNVWYQPYVDYCQDSGIIEAGKSFNWKKNATRAEMAYLFARADIYDYVPNPDVPITDIPDVTSSTPYSDQILALYRRGIAAGSDEMYTYHPNDNIRRSEVSALVSRILCFDMRLELAKG